MSNCQHPDDMTIEQRSDEIAAILAAGLLRLRAKENSPELSTHALIDVADCRSVCATVDEGETER